MNVLKNKIEMQKGIRLHFGSRYLHINTMLCEEKDIMPKKPIIKPFSEAHKKMLERQFGQIS